MTGQKDLFNQVCEKLKDQPWVEVDEDQMVLKRVTEEFFKYHDADKGV